MADIGGSCATSMNLQAESQTVQSVPIDTLILHQDKFLVPGPPWPWNLNAIRVDFDSDQNASVDPSTSGSGSSTSSIASNSEDRSLALHLPPRNFVWGGKVVRDALPCVQIPPWLDPVHVDIDDPTKLPLCWYGVPFRSGLVFPYARRIKVAAYIKHPILGLKVGDFDAYGTWPKLVEWFKEQTGFTMHLQRVWGESKPLLTFFTNHEIPRVTIENWDLIDVMLDEMGYPVECELKWYLDRGLAY